MHVHALRVCVATSASAFAITLLWRRLRRKYEVNDERSASHEVNDERPECPICYETGVSTVRTDCGHSFCVRGSDACSTCASCRRQLVFACRRDVGETTFRRPGGTLICHTFGYEVITLID